MADYNGTVKGSSQALKRMLESREKHSYKPGEREKEFAGYENKKKEMKGKSKSKALHKAKEEIGERIMPGHKRRKTMVSHEIDDHGVVVSYKPTNYLRK